MPTAAAASTAALADRPRYARTGRLGVYAAFVMLSGVTARARMNAWNPVIESLVNL